jgi:hypothetical protein
VNRRQVAWIALIVFLALLGAGTISNQIRINQANATLAQNAADGAAALARSCKLAGVSRKIYMDVLRRDVITSEDFALFSDTLQRACSRR